MTGKKKRSRKSITSPPAASKIDKRRHGDADDASAAITKKSSTPKPKRRKLTKKDPPVKQQQHDHQAEKQQEDAPELVPAAAAAEADGKFTQNEIVNHISIFLSRSSTGKSASSEEEESPMMHSITYLVEFLGDTDADGQKYNDVIITKEDVATLLLPWSIASLMRRLASSSSSSDSSNTHQDEDRTMAWNAFSCCLDIMSSPSGTTAALSSCEALLSSSLSQSTLNRLVHYAARISFEASTTTSQVVQSYASNCFLHLTKRFRPTLDDACSALLREVDVLVSSVSKEGGDNILLPTHQSNVVRATLQLLQSLMSNANPKRLFGTIRSVEVLPCLGRLMMVKEASADKKASKAKVAGKEVQMMDDEAHDPSAEERVQDILWEGIFNPVHHMDGFRTMSELLVMPSLPKLSSSSGDDDNKGDDGEEANDGPAIASEDVPTKDVPTDVPVSKGGKGGGKKKMCYQSSLFTSLQSLLSLSASGDDSEGVVEATRKEAINDATATANLLPIITHGFFERIRAKAAGASASSSSEGDAKLQFRFWCHAIHPAMEQLFRIIRSSADDVDADELKLALLQSTSAMLNLVLKYDAYLPSYNDPNEDHVKFLECVTKGILHCITTDLGGTKGRSSFYLITSLRHLLLLNHRLLHDRLAEVICFACSCLSTSGDDQTQKTAQAAANGLLSTIVKTYRELRQVGYFLTSARDAFVCKSGDVGSMKCLLTCGNIIESLALGYQTCPSGQLHEIWEFFDAWIVTVVDTKFESSSSIMATTDTDDNNAASAPTTTTEDELSFAVQMFIIFIKNIRANKQNSLELRDYCEKSMTTSISKLLGKKKKKSSSPTISGGNNGILTQQLGFDLCGWLVDLHTRSCFWIDDNVDNNGHYGRKTSSFLLTHDDDDSDNLNVLDYLRNIVESTVSTAQFKLWRESWLDTYWQSTAAAMVNGSNNCDIIGAGVVPPQLRGSLQRLALHRIHQLHSMIYYCNLQENEQNDDLTNNDRSSKSQALTNEAKMLVDFVLYIACSQLSRMQSATAYDATTDDESLWAPVAQSLCIWAHYCEPFHAEIFLIWFFTTLCRQNESPQEVCRLENTIALTLARDASFYNVEKVTSLFMKVGIQYAFNKFLDSIETTGTPSDTIFQESSGLTISCMELAEKKNGAKLSSQHDNNHNIGSVSTCLSFLASAPLELALCNENLILLDRVVGLDILSSQVITKQAELMDAQEYNGGGAKQLLNIVRCTKIIIANLLSKTLLLSSDFDTTPPPCLANMIRQLSKSSCFDFTLFDDDNNGVSSASTNAISEYFSMCIDYHEKNDNNMLVEFFDQMKRTLLRDDDDAADGIDFSPTILLTRSVIRRMNILDRNHSLSKKKTTTLGKSSYELCMSFVLDVQKRLKSSIIQHLSKAAGEGLENNDKAVAAANALLLESDILTFIGNHLDTTMPVTKILVMTKEEVEESNESVRIVFEMVTTCMMKGSQSSSLKFINATSYFFSSMAATPGHFLKCVSPSIVLKNILVALAQSFSSSDQVECPLLDAAFCSLIRNSGLEEMKVVTAHLLSQPVGGKNSRDYDSAFITKIFHLLITCANSQEQQKYLSGKCKTFLVISMDLLRREYGSSAQHLVSNVELFSKTITTLISKKELLLLSGREIAMICCEMNPLFHYYDDGINKECDNLLLEEGGGGALIFKSCCLVVASLIAHYPKQLYGCPSPLFSLLLALLSHLLQTSSVKNGLSQKALEYAKVCELLIPHKDIFKKHVVGLILRYIQSLNEGMNPTTKSKLMPSIYAMLDMCSDFETRQINAMIDVSSKTLFAPVFQSYQKYYRYHGQA